MAPKHFLDIDALDSKTLRAIIDLATSIKRKGRAPKSLKLKPGAVLAMIFEKPSTRTRVSFEVAIHQLGGTSLVLNPQDMQLGRGETLGDTARVLSRYVDVIMLRTGPQETLTELAANATVPVINGLTCRSHPCQVMADVMTFEELKGPIKGRIIAWIGDANNVATSWVHAAARFGFRLRIASPKAAAQSVIGRKHAAYKGNERHGVTPIVAQRVDIPPGITTAWDDVIEAKYEITWAAASRPDSAAIGTPGPGCVLPPAR
jgi:ornithine carbamoyltransferase